MADSQAKIIENHPIGAGLDSFHVAFGSLCRDRDVSCAPDVLDQLDQDGKGNLQLGDFYLTNKDLRKLALPFLFSLQSLPVADLLPSKTNRGTVQDDILRLISAVASDFDRLKPLLRAVLNNKDDDIIWKEVYRVTVESTPPPRSKASAVEQTPWVRNTSSFVNSSEHRKYVDGVLKEELGPMYVGLHDFQETFFGGIPNLATASEAVFKRCKEGDNPLYREGWCGWPADAKEDRVLSWISEVNEKLATFAQELVSTPALRRRPLAQPNQPVLGSTSERKSDIGFVNDSSAKKDSKCHWSQILVPGELKSNPSADIHSKAWLDLGTYAREVLAAQDSRRFVLGFTLCGSLMRLWEFDRLGGIASD